MSDKVRHVNELAVSIKRKKMRQYYLVAILILLSISVFGQKAYNTEERNESNIYNQAIIQYVKYLKQENIEIGDSLFFMESTESSLTDSLLTHIEKLNLLTIRQSDIDTFIMKRKETIALYKIFPLSYYKGEFFVPLLPLGAHYDYNKNESHFVNSGTCRIFFKFKNGEFLFYKIQSLGI